MNLEQLKTFCGIEKTRPKLLDPFSIGEFSFASDGRILVRVPKIESVALAADENFAKQVGRVFSQPHNPNTVAFPTEIPAFDGANVCQHCKGTGVCDCKKCGRTYGGGGCDACCGGLFNEIPQGVPFGNQIVSNFYLLKLKDLPGIQLFNGVDETSCMHFVFEGGEGKLMPIVKKITP